jgi:hypothetical protein
MRAQVFIDPNAIIRRGTGDQVSLNLILYKPQALCPALLSLPTWSAWSP